MELAELLTQALKLEVDGRDFYRRAAELAPEAAEMFERLADDEEQHYAYIERLYHSLQTGVEPTALPDIDNVPAIDLADPIFPRGVSPLEVLPPQPTVNDALVFGMSSEIKSIRLYRTAAEQATAYSKAHKLLTQLVQAEIGHFNTLMQRYEALNPYPV